MTKPPEDSGISRREFLRGAAGVAGSLAVGSLVGPELAAAIPRRRLAPTKVVFMGQELTKDLITEFEAAHPNISLEVLNWDSGRFQAMMAAGQPPDVWRTQAPLVPQWASRGQLLDLDPYFKASDLIHPADLTPANDYYRYKGGKIGVGPRYGMVKDWSPDETVWVRTDLFRRTGIDVPGPTDRWTYDDLWEIALKLKKKNPSLKWILDVANSYTWIDRHVMVQLASIGKSLYPKDFSRINLTKNPAAMEAFRYSFRYAQRKMALGPENPNKNGWSGPDFIAGKVAMTQYGYWFLGMHTGQAKASANSRLLTAPIWKGGKRLDPTITATGWVISGKTSNPDAAWTLFEWYMGGKPARDRAGIGWGVPAQLSLFDRLPTQTAVQRNAKKTLLHELPTSKVTLQFNPNLIGLEDNTAVASAYLKYIGTAAKGKLSFEDFMKKVEADTNRAIEVGKRG
ncbi:MAG TPA: extracellular solute-binding protein [Gaiellaceae bacterium]|jgi:multiple sugar transport system substrate-binding protein